MVKSKSYTSSYFTITKITFLKPLFQRQTFDSCILLNFANGKRNVFAIRMLLIRNSFPIIIHTKGNEVRLGTIHKRLCPNFQYFGLPFLPLSPLVVSGPLILKETLPCFYPRLSRLLGFSEMFLFL